MLVLVLRTNSLNTDPSVVSFATELYTHISMNTKHAYILTYTLSTTTESYGGKSVCYTKHNTSQDTLLTLHESTVYCSIRQLTPLLSERVPRCVYLSYLLPATNLAETVQNEAMCKLYFSE